MLFKKKFKLFSLITTFFLIVPISSKAINFSQFITLKADGTGSIKIVYTEKESIVKEKNFLIGNLPFTKEKLSEFFSSPKVNTKDYKVENNPKDNTQTQVSFEINFNNISDLNSLKGLVNNQFDITNSDSGNEFKNTIVPDFINTNSIEQLYSVLYPQSPIKTSNGSLKDKNVFWFTGKNIKNLKDPFVYKAVFNPVGNKPEIKTKEVEEEKGKSCGLFGIELPVILILGSLLINNRRIKFFQ